MLRLMICMAFLTTVLDSWATGQEVSPTLSDTEKQQALQELKEQRQYVVYRPGCRVGNAELGKFEKLSDAITAAQKDQITTGATGAEGAFIAIGDSSNINRLDDRKAKIFVVRTSLRCGSPYIVAKYSSAAEARAVKEQVAGVWLLDTRESTEGKSAK